jgi:hypothetical protein
MHTHDGREGAKFGRVTVLGNSNITRRSVSSAAALG